MRKMRMSGDTLTVVRKLRSKPGYRKWTMPGKAVYQGNPFGANALTCRAEWSGATSLSLRRAKNRTLKWPTRTKAPGFGTGQLPETLRAIEDQDIHGRASL